MNMSTYLYECISASVDVRMALHVALSHLARGPLTFGTWPSHIWQALEAAEANCMFATRLYSQGAAPLVRLRSADTKLWTRPGRITRDEISSGVELVLWH